MWSKKGRAIGASTAFPIGAAIYGCGVPWDEVGKKRHELRCGQRTWDLSSWQVQVLTNAQTGFVRISNVGGRNVERYGVAQRVPAQDYRRSGPSRRTRTEAVGQ
jgi:hypothetical protein